MVALILILVRAGGGASDSGVENAPQPSIPESVPLAISVNAGKASIDISTRGPESRTLVIVSALARQGGPYSVRITARPIENPKPIDRAPVATLRLPRIGLPKPARPPEPVAGLPPSHRTFHVLAHGGDVTRASSYRAIEGHLTAVGRRIQVYVEAGDLGTVTSETLRDLVATFDDSVYPSAASRFGAASDVDGDGRFTVLFSSVLTRLAGGKTSVEGFVRGADLDPTLDAPFGNRCDMMYLSTSLTSGPHLRTIIAHEYTHAVSFSRKALASHPTALEEEGWLDEGIAHLVEDSHGFSKSNIDYRVSAFLSKPERYRLVVDDYYAANLFRSHGNRGATYLFLRWCVDRYGPSLLDSLLRSEERGVSNLEAATGATFADLFRRWTVALALSGIDPASEPDEAYRSLDLRGELEDWLLAGPRMSHVRPGGPGDSWSAEATTAHYAVIEGSSRGGVAIEVDGPSEAELQVTAVRLTLSAGRPEVSVQVVPSSGPELLTRVEIVERDGSPVRLEALAWEPLVPLEDPRSFRQLRGGLDMLGIASSFGTSSLPARGNLSSRSIRLPNARALDGPLILKAVGIDARGRRVATWVEVPTGSKSDGISSAHLESP